MGRHGWPLFVGLMACSRAPDAEGPQAPSTGDDGTTEARPEPGAASTDAGADETTTGDTGAGTRGCLAIVGGQQAGGGRLDLELAEGLIRDAGVFDDDHPALECAEIVDARGRWLAPAFIDSHVHLAYLPVAESLAARGVAAAVDLASPLEFLDERPARPQVIASGPMITAVGGYPTQSWGAGGYGLECATARDAIAAVDEVHAHGAGVVKIPFDHRPALP
ncbi:MAG: hypothetical protein KDK70_31550, partial [Myxococcales bacterium]|nr:hypothetical protein [Myxococcales bacterium]